MAMAGWSSLPWDLINNVADRFLDTEDLDYYMDFRAVCQSWRSATADPKNSPHDPRFQPRQWFTLDEVHQDDARLFVNAATGRFVRKDLPLLRRYFLIGGAFVGLLVVAEESAPHAVRLLNPFTGSITRFVAPVPCESTFVAHVVGYAPPTLVLVGVLFGTIYWATPDSECFITEQGYKYTSYMVRQAVIGGIYAAAREHGKVPSLVAPEANKILGLFAKNFPEYFSGTNDEQVENRCFLVESEGETLVIFKPTQPRVIDVFKMDAGSNTLEPVKSIGSRALFVGDYRCLSVDADKFAFLEANCIYFVKMDMDDCIYYKVRAYSLTDDETELPAGTGRAICPSTYFTLYDSRPISVVQLLACYTLYVKPARTLCLAGGDYYFF
ncbi:hypothetical protein BS78_02G238300 [Paspalum vaginatum]|nr:hypothetical protein BS78_02G238300 [Paspalum vaginatum]